MQVDLADYESPPLAGFATGCAVIPMQDLFDIVFFEDQSASSPVNVARFFALRHDLELLWTNSKAFHETLSQEAAKVGWGRKAILKAAPEHLTRPVHPLVLCTAFPVAKSGASALLECYYVTASSIFRAMQGRGKVNVVPVFGIQMHTALMWSFLDHIRSVVE
jgi:hypothetical protein